MLVACSAVRAPPTDGAQPADFQPAVRLACLLITSDVAALAGTTENALPFSAAEAPLDVVAAEAAAEHGGEWLCAPFLWQVAPISFRTVYLDERKVEL